MAPRPAGVRLAVAALLAVGLFACCCRAQTAAPTTAQTAAPQDTSQPSQTGQSASADASTQPAAASADASQAATAQPAAASADASQAATSQPAQQATYQPRVKNVVEAPLYVNDPTKAPPLSTQANKALAVTEQALPTFAEKALAVTNAIYQNADFSRLLQTAMLLQNNNNQLGQFPGKDKYGFQADPNTYCLFAVPKLSQALPLFYKDMNAFQTRVANNIQALKPKSALQLSGMRTIGSAPAPDTAPAAMAAPTAEDMQAASASSPAAALAAMMAGVPAAAPAPEVAAPAPSDTPLSNALFPSAGYNQPASLSNSQVLATPAVADTAGLPSAAAALAAMPGAAGGAASPISAVPFGAYGPSPYGSVGQALAAPGGYGGTTSGPRRPPIAYYNSRTGGVTIVPPVALFTGMGNAIDKAAGNPFFDCIGIHPDAVPFKEFMAATGSDVSMLANNFVSYLKGGLRTQDGGLATSFRVVNPLNPQAEPLNMRFHVERPYFELPQGGLPTLPSTGPPGQPGQPGLDLASRRPGAPIIPSQNNANFGGQNFTSASPAAAPAPAAAPVAEPAAAPAAAPTQAPSAPGAQLSSIVFDGYLSDCTVILGSLPHADGTFEKSEDFPPTIVYQGTWSMPLSAARNHAGQAAYVVPAARGNVYPTLDTNTVNPGFCYDIGLLLPSFNPLASPLPIAMAPTGGSLVASPLSTVLVFGSSFGLTQQQLQSAFGINQNIDITTFNALGDAISDPNGKGAYVLKQDIKIQNAVTLGATLLTNQTVAYASFAVVVDQAIARQAIAPGTPLALPTEDDNATYAQAPAPSAAHTVSRRLLQDSGAPPLDLANPQAVQHLYNYAEGASALSEDPTIHSNLYPNLDDDLLGAAAQATANINAATDAAGNAFDAEKTAYYTQTVLTQQLDALRMGAMSRAQFDQVTSKDALALALTRTQLPGKLNGGSGSGPQFPQTQAPGGQAPASPGKGGKMALYIAVPIAAVIILLAAIFFGIYTAKRNRREPEPAPVAPSGGSGRFWWRSPLWGRGDSGSSPSGQPMHPQL